MGRGEDEGVLPLRQTAEAAHRAAERGQKVDGERGGRPHLALDERQNTDEVLRGRADLGADGTDRAAAISERQRARSLQTKRAVELLGHVSHDFVLALELPVDLARIRDLDHVRLAVCCGTIVEVALAGKRLDVGDGKTKLLLDKRGDLRVSDAWAAEALHVEAGGSSVRHIVEWDGGAEARTTAAVAARGRAVSAWPQGGARPAHVLRVELTYRILAHWDGSNAAVQGDSASLGS